MQDTVCSMQEINFGVYELISYSYNTVYYSSCHICEKQIWIEYITALTILYLKTIFYMRYFEEKLV